MASRYDKRIQHLEEKLGEAGKVPVGHRGPFIGWAGECEERFEEVKKDLLKRFGTIAGAEFLRISWGTPEAKNNI